jgi:zinc D-Ala-D-Ala carboxypeptidase
MVTLSRRNVLQIAGCIAAAGAAAGVIFLSEELNQKHRTLHLGTSGPDVAEVQIRVSGWLSENRLNCSYLKINGQFNESTAQAVRNFRRAYGLPASGVVDNLTWEQLDALAKPNGSTQHFDWQEFYMPGRPNFEGGSVSEDIVRENIRRLMFKLEALRLKGAEKPVDIITGFVPKNAPTVQEDPIAASLHTYGIAADIYVNINRAMLYKAAETCSFSGLGEIDQRVQHCDSRLEYQDYPSTASCWWQSGAI